MQFKNKFKGHEPTEIKSNKYEYGIFFWGFDKDAFYHHYCTCWLWMV